MIHCDRVFSSKELESEDELVEAITNHTWPLCYSFYHDGLLYLNDSDSEDDPVYVVMKFDRAEGHHDVHGRLVGQIRPKGMDINHIRSAISNFREGRWDAETPQHIVAEPVWHHSCQLCRLEEE